VRLLVFRALGPHHVALPVRGDRLAEAVARIEREQRVAGASVPSPYGGELGQYEIVGVRMHTHPLAVHEFFELEQYAYRPGRVTPEPGDVAIDGGGGWGDTALWLAYRVGSGGRVLCAEVDEANRKLIATNVALNPELAARIEVLPRALWSASGESVEYAVAGPSSSLVRTVRSEHHARVETVRVDDLGLERLDFLKLDVEGAELAALQGAEETLRRFRPKLAIAAYHDPDDLVDLPAFVDGLGAGYRLYLGHFTPGREETILFARADQQR
jgi:FkbM family methyltransferase